jgi:hypothetical protein
MSDAWKLAMDSLAETPTSSAGCPSEPAPIRAAVIDLAALRRWLEAERRDAAVNAAWDRLLVLAREAWNWRDPESLNALLEQILALSTETRADWDA